jgi:hypothetical protein
MALLLFACDLDDSSFRDGDDTSGEGSGGEASGGDESGDESGEDPDPPAQQAWSQSIGTTFDAQGIDHLVSDGAGGAVVFGHFSGTIELGGVSLVTETQAEEAPEILFGPLQRDLFLARVDGQGAVLWAKRFGDASDQLFDVATSRDFRAGRVAVDPDGRITVAGRLQGAVDLGGGPLVGDGSSLFVGHFDPAGEHLWSAAVGAGQDVNTVQLAATGAGRAVVGFGDLGGATLELRELVDGVVTWSRSLVAAGGAAHLRGLAAGPGGGVALSGTLAGELDLGSGVVVAGDPVVDPRFGHIFVARLDAGGDGVWARRSTGWIDQEGWDLVKSHTRLDHGLAVDADGQVVLASGLVGDADFGGGDLQGTLLASFAATGELAWSAAAPLFAAQDTDTQRLFVGLDAEGLLLLTGSCNTSVTLAGGGLDCGDPSDSPRVFVARVSAAGSLVTATVLPRAYPDLLAEAAVAAGVAAVGGTAIVGASTRSLGDDGVDGPSTARLSGDALLVRLAP